MARPIEGKERKHPFSFTVEPEIVDRLNEIAHRELRSKSEIVEELISNYVKAHTEGNPNYSLEKFGAGFKAFPAIWDDAYVETLTEYSQEDMEEMKMKAQKLIQRLDALIKPVEIIESDREKISRVFKRMHHIEDVLKNMDRNLGNPKMIEKMHSDNVRKMYDEMKKFQIEYDGLEKERAELTSKISGKPVVANVGN